MRPAGAGNTKRTAQAIQQKLDRLDEAFLFAVFGPDAARAQALYDPRGDQTLEELLVQVFMDSTMTEPARYLATSWRALASRYGSTGLRMFPKPSAENSWVRCTHLKSRSR